MEIKKFFNKFIKNNISFFVLLITLLFFYVLTNLLIYFEIVPNKNFLVDQIKEIYFNYGSLIIFFSTLFEGFLFFWTLLSWLCSFNFYSIYNSLYSSRCFINNLFSYLSSFYKFFFSLFYRI